MWQDSFITFCLAASRAGLRIVITTGVYNKTGFTISLLPRFIMIQTHGKMQRKITQPLNLYLGFFIIFPIIITARYV